MPSASSKVDIIIHMMLIMFFLWMQLMNLLFSFLEPNRPHSALLAGYFSKVYHYVTQ